MKHQSKGKHRELVRESRGKGDQLHVDKTQATATEMDRLRYARNEWTVTIARRAVHKVGGTEDKAWVLAGDAEQRRSDRRRHVSNSQPMGWMNIGGRARDLSRHQKLMNEGQRPVWLLTGELAANRLAFTVRRTPVNEDD